jgi:glucokinase
VGGTKIHLAMFSREAGRLVKGREVIVSTASAPSLGDAVAAFCAAEPVKPTAAGLGVAGPVVRGAAHGANLPWPVTAREVADAIGGGRVRLANDLEASAHSLVELGPDETESLQAGEALAGGNRGLVSPGTGLGECVLLHQEGRWLPAASEGGHADFAPRTDEEIDLQRWLRARYGRVRTVTVERREESGRVLEEVAYLLN